jgi:stearoyl-CoA desaturase (Delta-9 desaturase)
MPQVRDVAVSPDPTTIPGAPSHPDGPTLPVRILTILAIVIPFVGMIAAPLAAWGWGFHWADLGVLLGLYFFTVIGITVGFHRLFVHRSFESNIVVKCVLAVLGSMAVQGSLLSWVAQHRRHHQHSDTPDDPHSPHHHGGGLLGLLTGIWHSHIGWFFTPNPPNMNHYVKDLTASPTIRFVSFLFPLWVVMGFLIPGIIVGAISGTWFGVATGLLWGGLVRVFLVHHVTWSVNSACHMWGKRPFKSNDESRNNFLFGVLAMGEGWHNTHHAFPTSARHGLRWWQLDVSYWIIKMLAFCGLAWNIKLPSKESLLKERRSV